MRWRRKDLLLAGTRRSLLSNTLVIIVPTDASAAPKSASDLTKPEYKKLALAEPQTVPAGIYAREYLQKLGLWDAVKDKVVPTENVRAALAAVESGNVEAGFVYKTDALLSKKVKVAVEISAAEGPKISYPARGAEVIQGTRTSQEVCRLPRRSDSAARPSRSSASLSRSSGSAMTGRSVADRFLHDQSFGAQHAADLAVWDCDRLVAGAARLARKNSGGDAGHAAALRAAGRDRPGVADALQPARTAGIDCCERGLGLMWSLPGARSCWRARSCRFRCSCGAHKALSKK